MQVIENEQVICFDVDDTLVKWGDNYMHPHKNKAGTIDAIDFIDPYDNSVLYLIPHLKHIALLKKMKGRGYYVRVWSAGGVKWAEAVIRKLELESFVDSVETKPIKYVDDLITVSDILGSRIYLQQED
jgi:phosphoserine phosphatase